MIEDHSDGSIHYGATMYGEFVLGRLADWPYRPSERSPHQRPAKEDADYLTRVFASNPFRHYAREDTRGFDVSKENSRMMRAWLMGHRIDEPMVITRRSPVVRSPWPVRLGGER